MSIELDIGDQVILKSGGPKMTVTNLAANGVVRCTWFLQIASINGGWDGPKFENFPNDSLNKA